eukprot:Gb_28837 [translate_table: standard]
MGGSEIAGHESILIELVQHLQFCREFNGATDAVQPSDLDKTLEVLMSYSRSEHGRHELGNLGALASLLNYLKAFLDNHNSISTSPSCSPQHPERYYKVIYTLLKILRNLCAGELINQNSFLVNGGVQITASLAKTMLPVNFRVSIGDTQHLKNLPSHVLDVFQMILQLLGNVSLAGNDQQSAVWKAFFPRIFAEFALVQNTKIHEPLCMVIYTCCKDDQERLKELCENAGSSVFIGLLRTSNTVGIEGDWFELLLTKIVFIEQYFRCLFSSLRSREDFLIDKVEDGGETFTAEQAYLLRVIFYILNQQMKDDSQLGECRLVLREFVAFLVEIVSKAERSVDFSFTTPSTLPTGLAAIDVLGFSLNILRDVCAWEDPQCMKLLQSSVPAYQNPEFQSLSVVDSAVTSNLIKVMINILRDLGPPEAVKKATMQAGSQSSNPQEGKGNTPEDRDRDASISQDGNIAGTPEIRQIEKMCPYKGYRRDIVSVLANATFRRKHVQDQIRECGGIFLLLQQCVVDAYNPFLREWGLWAVRNLLEDNLENQREVAELELQESVNSPEISQMGLRVEIDQNTRRPKLMNLSA